MVYTWHCKHIFGSFITFDYLLTSSDLCIYLLSLKNIVWKSCVYNVRYYVKNGISRCIFTICEYCIRNFEKIVFLWAFIIFTFLYIFWTLFTLFWPFVIFGVKYLLIVICAYKYCVNMPIIVLISVKIRVWYHCFQIPGMFTPLGTRELFKNNFWVGMGSWY